MKRTIWNFRSVGFLAALLIAGCVATKPMPPSDASIDGATVSGRIHAGAGFIVGLTEQILKMESLAQATPQVESIKATAQGIDMDQTEADRLDAVERKEFNDQIEALKAENAAKDKKIDEANSTNFKLVRLFGSVGGLILFVVGAYAAVSGKALWDGIGLMAAGGAGIAVAVTIAHFGWLIALIIVIGLGVLATWQIIELIRRYKMAGVSIADELARAIENGTVTISPEAFEAFKRYQTKLAGRLVDVVTNKAKKSKAGK